MTSNHIISFTSDFGDADGYVGIVKGAILSVNKSATIVDISHDVQPYNIASAAWIIYNAFNYFPPGTVHLVVVDPGVGSQQRRIILQHGSESFVGPDNGVFSLVVQDPLGKRAKSDPLEAFDLLKDAEKHAKQLSSTFHARDLFGPIAASLSLGYAASELGQKIDIDTLERIDSLEIERHEGSLKGRVIHVDRFGNLVTNLPNIKLPSSALFTINDQKVGPIAKTYRSVEKGQPTAIMGSHGFVEIAVCEGRADQALDAEIGSIVVAHIDKR